MEPIGLAVGVAGLAGLFSTCIECFNIVQRGRYLGRDYFILETKYTNQRLRLLTWGRACGLTDAGTPAAEGWDEDILTAVSRTLAQIALLFQDHQALRKRYGLSPERSGLGGRVSNTQAILNALTSGFRDTSLAISEAAVFPPLPRSPAKGPSISAAVRWAVDDKRTFAELVDHLKDFIDGLEGVTAGLNVPQRQREMIRVEVGHISDFSELEMIEEARMGNSDAVADAASLRLCQLQDTASVVPAAGPPIARGPVTTPGSPLPKETIHSVDPDWDMVEPTMAQSTGSTDSCYVVLHRVICDPRSMDAFFNPPSYKNKNGGDTNAQWLVINADTPLREPTTLHLSGRRPLRDLRSYLKNNTQLSFLIFRDYGCEHEPDSCREVAEVKPFQMCIYLVSERLCTLFNLWLPQNTLDDDFRPFTELRPPFPWFYYNRDLINNHHYDNMSMWPWSQTS